jgi:hypothetical protein
MPYKVLTLSTELLDGLLPVLICAPPESPSEEPRKIYYHADGTDDNTPSPEASSVADNRRTTRSTGAAATATSSRASTQPSSLQQQKCPEIHIFSSKSRIAKNSDNDIVEVPPSTHGTKNRSKKRPLPDDDDDVFEIDKANSKRSPFRPLFDEDDDEKPVPKKGDKVTKKRGDASTMKAGKQKDKKRSAEVIRGGRGGRAVSRGGKRSTRAMKSKVVW